MITFHAQRLEDEAENLRKELAKGEPNRERVALLRDRVVKLSLKVARLAREIEKEASR